jgi:hypothetical protein
MISSDREKILEREWIFSGQFFSDEIRQSLVLIARASIKGFDKNAE